MVRSFLVGVSLSLANSQSPFDDEHALLQARVKPVAFEEEDKEDHKKGQQTAVLLESVRTLARSGITQESPEAVTALLTSVTETVQTMKPMIIDEHGTAQASIDSQFAEITACGASENHGADVVANHADQVAALEECSAARARVTSAQEHACAAWVSHAESTRRAFPDLSGEATPDQILAHMREWETFLQDEVSGMETRKAACLAATETLVATGTRCDAVESENSGAVCDHERTCTLLHACHDHEVEIYGTVIAESVVGMTSRQNQWHTLTQVECLLGLISTAVSNEEVVAEDALNRCDDNAANADLVLSTPDAEVVSDCPALSGECPEVQLPPLWDQGEQDGLEPDEGETRLYGGTENRGLLEVYHNGEWGYICDDGFGHWNGPNAVCQILGFTAGTEYNADGRQSSRSGSRLWLDNVDCRNPPAGGFQSIMDCQHNPWGNHNCGHHEAVGLECSGRRAEAGANGVRFFNNLVGSSHVIGHFEHSGATTQGARSMERINCASRVMRAHVTGGNCGDATIQFRIDDSTYNYFKDGAQASWRPVTEAQLVSGTANMEMPTKIWTGQGGNRGWILSNERHTSQGGTFASSYNPNNAWDQCNGLSLGGGETVELFCVV